MPEIGIGYQYLLFLDEEELLDELFILEVDGVFLLEDVADGGGCGDGLQLVHYLLLL